MKKFLFTLIALSFAVQLKADQPEQVSAQKDIRTFFKDNAAEIAAGSVAGVATLSACGSAAFNVFLGRMYDYYSTVLHKYMVQRQEQVFADGFKHLNQENQPISWHDWAGLKQQYIDSLDAKHYENSQSPVYFWLAHLRERDRDFCSVTRPACSDYMYVEIKQTSQNSAEFLKLKSSVIKWCIRDSRYRKVSFIAAAVAAGIAGISALAYLGYWLFDKKPADKKEVVTQ